MSQAATVCHVLLEQKPAYSSTKKPDEILVFSKLRNEKLRLPAFLRHYRSLGVDRFFMVDNDSTDGSREYLQAQPDVHLFRTAGRFREARGGTDWLNALLAEFGVGAWCVTVDVDELLWFPGSDRATLRSLTNYMDSKGYEALTCLLLDLYPSGPLKSCAYDSADDLVNAAPYFDISPYDRTKPESTHSPGYGIFGGVRGRVFYPEARERALGWMLRYAICTWLPYRVPFLRKSPLLRKYRPKISPNLTKIPLVRWDRESRYLDVNHSMTPKVVAPETGVLLHFKFLQDFHEKALLEVSRGEYFDGAAEYRRYCEKVKLDPEVSFMYAGSTRIENPDQLVELGLMHDSVEWALERRPSMLDSSGDRP